MKHHRSLFLGDRGDAVASVSGVARVDELAEGRTHSDSNSSILAYQVAFVKMKTLEAFLLTLNDSDQGK
jgi:hypothetical protein